MGLPDLTLQIDRLEMSLRAPAKNGARSMIFRASLDHISVATVVATAAAVNSSASSTGNPSESATSPSRIAIAAGTTLQIKVAVDAVTCLVYADGHVEATPAAAAALPPGQSPASLSEHENASSSHVVTLLSSSGHHGKTEKFFVGLVRATVDSLRFFCLLLKYLCLCIVYIYCTQLCHLRCL